MSRATLAHRYIDASHAPNAEACIPEDEVRQFCQAFNATKPHHAKGPRPEPDFVQLRLRVVSKFVKLTRSIPSLQDELLDKPRCLTQLNWNLFYKLALQADTDKQLTPNHSEHTDNFDMVKHHKAQNNHPNSSAQQDVSGSDTLSPIRSNFMTRYWNDVTDDGGVPPNFNEYVKSEIERANTDSSLYSPYDIGQPASKQQSDEEAAILESFAFLRNLIGSESQELDQARQSNRPDSDLPQELKSREEKAMEEGTPTRDCSSPDHTRAIFCAFEGLKRMCDSSKQLFATWKQQLEQRKDRCKERDLSQQLTKALRYTEKLQELNNALEEAVAYLIKLLKEDWGNLISERKLDLIERVEELYAHIVKLRNPDICIAVTGHTSSGKTTMLATFTGLNLPTAAEANTALPLRLVSTPLAQHATLRMPKEFVEYLAHTIARISETLATMKRDGIAITCSKVLSSEEEQIFDRLHAFGDQYTPDRNTHMPTQAEDLCVLVRENFQFCQEETEEQMIFHHLSELNHFIRLLYKLKSKARFAHRFRGIDPLSADPRSLPAIYCRFTALEGCSMPGTFTIIDTPGSSETLADEHAQDGLNQKLLSIVKATLQSADRAIVLGNPTSVDTAPFTQSVKLVRDSARARKMSIVVNAIDQWNPADPGIWKRKLEEKARLLASQHALPLRDVRGVSARNARAALIGFANISNLNEKKVKKLWKPERDDELPGKLKLTSEELTSMQTLLEKSFGSSWRMKAQREYKDKKLQGLLTELEREKDALLETAQWSGLVLYLSEEPLLSELCTRAEAAAQSVLEVLHSESNQVTLSIMTLEMEMEMRKVVLHELMKLVKSVTKFKRSLEVKAVPENWSAVIEAKALELERELESHTNYTIDDVFRGVFFSRSKLANQDSRFVETKLANLQKRIVSYFEQQYEKNFDDVKESTKNAAIAERSEVKDKMVNYTKDLFQSLRSLQAVNGGIVADIVTITKAFEEAIIEKLQTTLKTQRGKPIEVAMKTTVSVTTKKVQKSRIERVEKYYIWHWLYIWPRMEDREVWEEVTEYSVTKDDVVKPYKERQAKCLKVFRINATKYISQEYTELQADLCQQLGSFLNGINDLMKTAGHSPQNEAARIKLYHSLQDHLDISKQSSVEMIMRDMKEFIHHAAPVGDELEHKQPDDDQNALRESDDDSEEESSASSNGKIATDSKEVPHACVSGKDMWDDHTH